MDSPHRRSSSAVWTLHRTHSSGVILISRSREGEERPCVQAFRQCMPGIYAQHVLREPPLELLSSVKLLGLLLGIRERSNSAFFSLSILGLQATGYKCTQDPCDGRLFSCLTPLSKLAWCGGLLGYAQT